MRKLLLILVCAISVISCACTRQVVILDRDIETVKSDFDRYISSTGFSYKLKDDKNNLYNVLLTEYNMQYLLQSKPMVSYDIGFTCQFKSLGKDTLLNCKTYPNSTTPLSDVRKFLKEQKFEGIKYISYSEYLKTK